MIALIALMVTLLVACRSDREQRLPRDSGQMAALRAGGEMPPLAVSPALQRALSRRGITVEYRWLRAGGDSAGPTGAVFIDPVNGTRVALADSAFLDLSGVKSAELRRMGDGALVMLQLTDSAAERTLVQTDAHMGQRLGVLLNGELVHIATILAPLTSSIPLITNIPLDVATDIGRRIMGADGAKLAVP